MEMNLSVAGAQVKDIKDVARSEHPRFEPDDVSVKWNQ
jgi:hypothetical protein